MDFFDNIFFNIIDIIVIIFIIISCIIATYRGFVKELFSMICWIGAIIVSFHVYPDLKIEVELYFKNKVIIDTISFLIPFLITLFLSNILAKWLSPKFSMPGILFFDKIGGLFFGALRGFLLIILLYLGYIYLLGKEINSPLPNILLESSTYPYIEKSVSVIRDLFPEELNSLDIVNEKIIEKKDVLINK